MVVRQSTTTTMHDSPDLGTKHEFHGAQPVLPVHDVDVSVRYYCDVLGFESDFLWGDPPVHGRVMKGDRTYGDPVYIHFTTVTGDEIRPSGQIRVHIGHDVDGLFEAYRALGVDVMGEPRSEPWGLREFAIRDGDGHVLCFCGYDAKEV